MLVNSNVKRIVFIANKQPLKNDIDSFIYKWNVTYPIDRWWREKHKIAFNSPEHRVVSFLDIYVEWREDQLINKAQANAVKNLEYKPGDWLTERKQEISLEDEIREFENMDLSKLDDTKLNHG
jgi:hypothetical protein